MPSRNNIQHVRPVYFEVQGLEAFINADFVKKSDSEAGRQQIYRKYLAHANRNGEEAFKNFQRDYESNSMYNKFRDERLGRVKEVAKFLNGLWVTSGKQGLAGDGVLTDEVSGRLSDHVNDELYARYLSDRKDQDYLPDKSEEIYVLWWNGTLNLGKRDCDSIIAGFRDFLDKQPDEASGKLPPGFKWTTKTAKDPEKKNPVKRKRGGGGGGTGKGRKRAKVLKFSDISPEVREKFLDNLVDQLKDTFSGEGGKVVIDLTTDENAEAFRGLVQAAIDLTEEDGEEEPAADA